MSGAAAPIASLGGATRWFDAHCHLHGEYANGHAGPNRTPAEAAADLIALGRDAGVQRMVTIGTTVADSMSAMAVASDHDDIYATAGVHPHEAKDGIDGLEALLTGGGVVAVGECGLDLHYEHSPRDAQREVFAAQIALARQYDLALVIHTRSAWDDTFDVLAAEGVPERTVIHCFTGGPDEARRCLDLGASLSISGIVTFKSADDIRAAVAVCPSDRLMVETDAPFLAPVPHRGKPNQPALVPLVGAAVAAVQGREVADVAATSWAVASRLYGLLA